VAPRYRLEPVFPTTAVWEPACATNAPGAHTEARGAVLALLVTRQSVPSLYSSNTSVLLRTSLVDAHRPGTALARPGK